MSPNDQRPAAEETRSGGSLNRQLAVEAELKLLADLEQLHGSAVKAARQVHEFRKLNWRDSLDRPVVREIIEIQLHKANGSETDVYDLVTNILERLKNYE